MAEENKLTVATFEQIAEIMSHLATNYTNLATTYYNMFYNTTPQDITLKLYNENGELQDFIVPNRAKDFNFTRNGEGSPEGVLSAPVGTTYQDTLNGTLYIKRINAGNLGWEVVGSETGIKKGEGSPEAIIEGRKGDLYVNTATAGLYIKTSDIGSAGWVLISADTRNLANLDLSNLSTEGNNKFLNKSLSNLNDVGQGVLDEKENISNKVVNVTSSSTDGQYPSAKATYTFVSGGYANKSLSNLNSTGNNKFVNKDLDNLSQVGQSVIDAKQNVIDNVLTTTSKAVVGAINEINSLANRLSDEKVDISSLVETYPVIDTWVSGTEGYRIWSDGYCEQWGRTSATTSVNITFLKIMKDTLYNPQITVLNNNSDQNWAATSLLTTGFTLVDSESKEHSWKASGYLAEGEF